MPIPSSRYEMLRRQAIRDPIDDNIYERSTLLRGMALNTGGNVPPWWSEARDIALRRILRSSDALSGATNTMIVRLVATPWSVVPDHPHIDNDRRVAELTTENIMVNSGIFRGWHSEFAKFLLDFFSQDNGGFLMLMADGRKDLPVPIGTIPSGVMHLDSRYCVRTGHDKWPVIYNHPETGRLVRIHTSRIIAMADMESGDARMHGVGFCAVSRCLDAVRNLIDIARYKQEKMGSRPQRGFITFNGISMEQAIQHMKQWKIKMGASNLTRFSQLLGLASPEGRLSIDITDLASVPDGFDEETWVTLGMYFIALAFNVDARELWPISDSGSRGDAQTQHAKALVKMWGYIMARFTTQMSHKFLPPNQQFVFDFKDDQQDKNQADIRWLRARQRKVELDSGAMNQRATRVDALRSGDITHDEFVLMEAADRRTPGGDPIEILFYDTRDTRMSGLLNMGVDDPLDVNANDATVINRRIQERRIEIYGQLAVTTSALARNKARQALAALNTLEEMYNPVFSQALDNLEGAIENGVADEIAQVDPETLGDGGDGNEPLEGGN